MMNEIDYKVVEKKYSLIDRYQTLFMKSVDAGFITSRAGDFEEVNEAFLDLFGYSREEIKSLRAMDTYCNPDARSAFSEVIEANGFVKDYPIDLIKKDGATINCLVNANLRVNTKRCILGYQGTIKDITERMKAEKQFLAYQDKLYRLTAELALTEERELQRISSVLHERVGQMLAIAKIKLEMLSKLYSDVAFKKSVQEVTTTIQGITDQIRSLTYELSHPVLYVMGLTAALEWLGEKIQNEHGLKVLIEDDGHAQSLSKDVVVILFRSVQELLVNIWKHANATVARVHVRGKEDKVRISVIDDGVGFDSSQIDYCDERNSGFGLFSIDAAIRSLNGNMEVISKPGFGTRIQLTVPK
jgi:PAS domain S-box-containing protein